MANKEQLSIASLRPLPHDFFDTDVEVAAKALISTYLLTVDDGGNRTGGKIVETEAYDQDDLAAHCHQDADKRRREGSKSMLLQGGHAYIYPYRLSVSVEKQMWCLNFTCDRENFGSAVLIRALQPLWGLELMRKRRRECYQAKYLDNEQNYHKYLCNGPAKLCESLNVTNLYDGVSLFKDPFKLFGRIDNPEIVCGPRVGIKKAAHSPRQYALCGSEFISMRGDKWYPLSAAACR